MADEPDLGKIEALEAEIVELKAKIEAQAAELAEMRAENRSLYEHLSARDRTNTALARYVDELLVHAAELDSRERGRSDQAAAAAVRDLASTAGFAAGTMAPFRRT